eukprot:TRINITY_DN110759_c0_g1_i1.p1 TRINITY_DN110759_c0_g1~~TRINITY_DN110759_c0_g1_i1.p1  ORF type:complete len:586 (-),score=122.55 TRINITY_DN110759_c0_g1_i1:43-1800(-)
MSAQSEWQAEGVLASPPEPPPELSSLHDVELAVTRLLHEHQKALQEQLQNQEHRIADAVLDGMRKSHLEKGHTWKKMVTEAFVESSKHEVDVEPQKLQKKSKDPEGAAPQDLHGQEAGAKAAQVKTQKTVQRMVSESHFTGVLEAFGDRKEQGEAEHSWHAYQLWARRAIEDAKFNNTLAVLIVINTCSIGVQVDWGIKNPFADEPAYFHAINVTFSVLFFLELMFRLSAYTTQTFSSLNPERGWNVFDCFVVLGSIVDGILSFTDSSMNVSALRIVRMARLMKILRVFRVVRFFTDLRVMVSGIILSAKTLIWALALLTITLFSLAVCVLQILRPYLSSSKNSENIAVLVDLYGSMFKSLYTLFQAVSGGVDWGDVASPLFNVDPLLGVIFCIYMCFALFCVLNVMTGVFVENASKTAMLDEEMVLMEEMRARKEHIDTVFKVFQETDKDGSGDIAFEEFVECCQDMRTRSCFKKLGIALESAVDLRNVFEQLDLAGKGKLRIQDLSLGIQLFSGPAKNIDLARCITQVQQMSQTLDRFLAALATDETSAQQEHRSHKGVKEEKSIREEAEADVLPGSLSNEER